jgi:hydroxymethylpyrimidine/phosphomethylpyrimidine kinase
VVVIKGGHMAGELATDLVYDGSAFHELDAPRVATANTHGTGCTFAAAIAANLAFGFGLLDAIRRAKDYVTGAIRHGMAVGAGHGALDHFWRLRAQHASAEEAQSP